MDEQTIPASNPVSDAVKRIDINQLVSRLKGLLQTPAAELESAKAESLTVRDIYEKYVILLVVVPAVCAFIGTSLLGPVPLGTGLKSLIFQSVIGLGGFYVGSLLVQTLSPHFGGTAVQTEVMKWMVCISFVTAAAGMLTLFFFIPFTAIIIGLVQLVAAVYAIYISWLGLPIHLGITDSRRLPFLLSLIGCGIVIAVVFAALGLTAV